MNNQPRIVRRHIWWRSWFIVCLALLAGPAAAQSEIVRQRGFVEGSLVGFPQEAPNDPTQAVGDLRVRDEVFVKPRDWIQFAGGMEFRANSHDQVDDQWSVDFRDRGALRPRLSVRRLTATLTRGPVTIDLGKQFVRWGTTDIVNPTDRFAPRDFMNVVDSEFLGITGARAVARLRGHTFEVVWTPSLTPSRTPLSTQRWTAAAPDTQGIPIVPVSPERPSGSQTGIRWGHVTGRLEYSLSFFDGFNHQPDVQSTVKFSGQLPPRPVAIEVRSVFPPIRTYGADMALPIRWFTIKAEAAYFTSSSDASDEYVLYVAQLERQIGEWMLVGGYAGEVVSRHGSAASFAPDRGASRALLARISRTIDVRRSAVFEGAARQNGRGAYGKLEYSQTYGQHWRGTLTGVAIGGHSDDFFGQYNQNSHVMLTARYSF